MGFINDNEVPGDGLEFVAHAVGEVEGDDHDRLGVQRRSSFAQRFPVAFGVQHHRRQVEFLLQFQCPLFAQ